MTTRTTTRTTTTEFQRTEKQTRLRCRAHCKPGFFIPMNRLSLMEGDLRRIAAERDAMSEADRSYMTVNLRVDEDVRMGIVSDVKQELRRCSALKIMYAARKTGVQ